MRLDSAAGLDRASYAQVRDDLQHRRGWQLTAAQQGAPYDWLGRAPSDRCPRLVAVGPLGGSERRRLADVAAERGVVAYQALARRGHVVLLSVL